MNELVIATRESPLALWQAKHVQAALEAAHPGLTVSLLGMKTQGDKWLSSPLSEVGGKGLFLKELEQALLEGRAHLAEHGALLQVRARVRRTRTVTVTVTVTLILTLTLSLILT